MTIQRRPFDPSDPVQREQWLEWRRQDITASTIGALFGCDPYRTALRLYVEKRGVEFPEPDDNKVMRRGRWLEPAVAQAVRELRPEWKLDKPDVYLRDPDLRLGATPDFYVYVNGRRGVLQAKTAAPSVYHREWASGEEPPLWVTLQTSVEAMLAEADFAVVAVMLVDPHDTDVKIHEFERNAAAERKIVAAVKDFWQRVANGLEPDPDYGRDADVIRALVPRETPGKSLDLSTNNRVRPLVDERAALMDDIASLDARKTAIEAELKHMIGDAELVTGVNGWRITFKTQERAGYSVPAKSSRVLRIVDKRPKEEAAA